MTLRMLSLLPLLGVSIFAQGGGATPAAYMSAAEIGKGLGTPSPTIPPLEPR